MRTSPERAGICWLYVLPAVGKLCFVFSACFLGNSEVFGDWTTVQDR